MNKEQKQKMKGELLTEISFKDEYGKWHNKVPLYREHIVTRIKEYLNSSGNELGKQAKDEGWLSINGKVGYSNYTIPDRACENLVGYLDLVLLRQYFLFYDIIYGWEFESMLPEVKEWLHSRLFKDNMFQNCVCPEVIIKSEHIALIRSKKGVI